MKTDFSKLWIRSQINAELATNADELQLRSERNL